MTVLVIYKYPINVDETTIEMPQGSKVLCLQLQNLVVHIWVLLDPDQPTEKRVFKVRGTGHIVGETEIYVGTWQSGPLVWHLFDCGV